VNDASPAPAPSLGARDLVARLLAPGCPPFALLHRLTPGRPQDVVEVLLGPVAHVERLADIPLPSGPPATPGPDALALVPFRQIRERGFDVPDDGTPLAVLRPQEAYELPLAEVRAALAERAGPAPVVEDAAFDLDDDAYAAVVRRVVDEEIGRGEGANFVIRRTFHGRVPGFGPAAALAFFARLLAGERGAYWTYTVHTPERTLVGASPEVHVRTAGGTVVMNPISGTYRYPEQGPSAEGLLAFLRDPKEVEELTMVVDEELKMMCTVGDLGGTVVGPRLREMAHLAHTEYELRGRSTMDVRDVLRETMFAATVTGSPVQNACRVIARHEPRGADGSARGYYGGALALIGRDAGGAQTLDSPILIRTADIAPDGTLRLPVGATLVRRSDPYAEAAETHAKAAGVLTALGVRRPPAERRTAGPRPAGTPRPRLADDIRVRAALDARRADLAPFWLRMRGGTDGEGPAAGPSGQAAHALVVDGEDTFTAMLAHVLRSTGLRVTVRRYDEPGLAEAALGHDGPVVLGPGPGDPMDTADPKMRLLRALAADLVRLHRPAGVVGVCLGHELIAAELGLPLVRKDEPYQGAQRGIDWFGRTETVGFYSSFTARCDDATAEELAMHRIELSRDPATGDVFGMRGPGFHGFQFHPESVLTLNGASLLAEALAPAAAVRP
jgi:phenazine biosynthesis protein phzE